MSLWVACVLHGILMRKREVAQNLSLYPVSRVQHDDLRRVPFDVTARGIALVPRIHILKISTILRTKQAI